MQRRILAAGVALTACLTAQTAHAFAPDASGVAETASLRPPARAAIGEGTAKSRLLAAPQGDGSFNFLGREALPVATFAFDVAGKAAHPVLSYFHKKVGDAKVELLQTSEMKDGSEAVVSYVQTLNGVPIVGTYAVAHVKGGAVTYASHYLVTPPALSTTPAVDAETARTDALVDVRSFAQSASAAQEPNLVVLYVLGQPMLAWQVVVTSEAPFGSWEEYVDAQAGSVVTRHKGSMDAVSGTVTAAAEPTCEGEAPVSTPVPYAQWTPGRATSLQGTFSSTSTPANAAVMLNGAYFSIYSADGKNYVWQPALQAAPTVNNIVLNSMPLGQIDPYLYLNQARVFMRARAATVPFMANTALASWFAGQVKVNANLPSGYQGFSCNAFYDPGSLSLNFYQDFPSWGCNNSGRSNKIVYHEYGHSIHHHLSGNSGMFDMQLSEGVADYTMATITGDPQVTGLTGCKTVLSSPGNVVNGRYVSRATWRTCENNYTYCGNTSCDAYPGDEVHHSAPVMCGALWDMRKQLISDLGQDAGALKADQIFLRFLAHATDMSKAYAAAIAADDDDDGNPANGTNHSCAINKAFLGDNGGFGHFPGQVGSRVPCVK